MSKDNDSRDYYHSSSNRSPGDDRSRRDERGERLPSIQETLGDVLGRPVTARHPGAQTHNTSLAESYSSSSGASSAGGYGLQPGPQYGSHTSRGGTYSPQHQSSQPQDPRHPHGRGEEPNQRTPGYTYGLYRATPGELVHEGSSTRDDFRQRPTRAPSGDASRRYACNECPERFDRPSTLEIHMRTHNGDRPFRCSYPGCNKSFTVRSNMRRHENTHGAASAFAPVEEDESSDDEDDQRGPSSSYFSRSGTSSNTHKSSSSHKLSSKTYSSSRR